MAEARIFQEMQAADAMREQMREGILNRFRESNTGQKMGQAYDALIQGMTGPANDIYRRVFEQGWYGKDVFDGRFQADMNPDSMRGMGSQYDNRAAFFGLDAQTSPEESPEMVQEPEEQHYEMDNENEMGM